MIVRTRPNWWIFSALFSGTNLWLTGSIAFSVTLLLHRINLVGQTTYLFLIWNLFLAAIPYLLSTTIIHSRWINGSFWKMFPLLVLWLLFFPNAPYIITDLFHLQPRQGIPEWYDLILITSFALNGLILGMLSLMHIHELIAERLHAFFGWLAAFVICLASGFGVYLGRFLRWNSWDMFSNPSPLIDDLKESLLGPPQYDQIHGMTLVMGMLLFLFYSLLKHLSDSKK